MNYLPTFLWASCCLIFGFLRSILYVIVCFIHFRITASDFPFTIYKLSYILVKKSNKPPKMSYITTNKKQLQRSRKDTDRIIWQIKIEIGTTKHTELLYLT